MQPAKAFIALVPAVFISLLASCSASLPQLEIDAAEKTLSAAQEARAETLAPDLYQNAINANRRLQENLKGTDYSETKRLARLVQDTAEKAYQEAKTLESTLKSDVDALQGQVFDLESVVKTEFGKAQKLGKRSGLDLEAINAALTLAGQSITSAKSLAENLDYSGAKTSFGLAMDGLNAQKAILDAAGFNK